MKTIKPSNSLVEKCPDILALWDYERNQGISPQNVSLHTKQKVWWRCEKGHSWQSPLYSRTREFRAGCPYCTGTVKICKVRYFMGDEYVRRKA